MLSWPDIKAHFWADGSWRDVVIAGATDADWTAMLRWLGDGRCLVEFTVDAEPAPLPARAGDELWRRQGECSQMIEVRVPGTPKCHFFWNDEIEFDIDPGEIEDEGTCAAFFEFVRGLGRCVGKPVDITPENRHELGLIRYDVMKDQFEQGGATLEDAERVP